MVLEITISCLPSHSTPPLAEGTKKTGHLYMHHTCCSSCLFPAYYHSSWGTCLWGRQSYAFFLVFWDPYFPQCWTSLESAFLAALVRHFGAELGIACSTWGRGAGGQSREMLAVPAGRGTLAGMLQSHKQRQSRLSLLGQSWKCWDLKSWGGIVVNSRWGTPGGYLGGGHVHQGCDQMLPGTHCRGRMLVTPRASITSNLGFRVETLEQTLPPPITLCVTMRYHNEVLPGGPPGATVTLCTLYVQKESASAGS